MDFCQRQRVTAPVNFLPSPAAQQAPFRQPLLAGKHRQAAPLGFQPEEAPAQSLPEVPSPTAGSDWCHPGSQGLLHDVPLLDATQSDSQQSGPDNAAPGMGLDSQPQQPSSLPGLQPSQSDLFTQPDAFSKQPSLAAPSICGDGSDQIHLDFNPCLDDPLPESPRAPGQPAFGPQNQSFQGLDCAAEDMVKNHPAAPGLVLLQPMEPSSISLGPEVKPAPSMIPHDEYPRLDEACFVRSTSASFRPDAAAAAAMMSVDEMTGMLCEPDVEDEKVNGMRCQGDRAGSRSQPLGLACWSEHLLQQASDPAAANKQLAGSPGRQRPVH